MKYKLIIHSKSLINDCKICCFGDKNNSAVCNAIEIGGGKKELGVMCYDYTRSYFIKDIQLPNNIKVL